MNKVLASCLPVMFIMHRFGTNSGTFLDAASAAMSALVLVKRLYRSWYFPDQPRRVRSLDPLRLKREASAAMRLA